MNYDTWKTTDFAYERQCELEEAEQAAIADTSDTLFDDYHLGDGDAVDEVMDTLEASDRWQAGMEQLRKAYFRPNESRKDKADRLLKAYESFMADLCQDMAKDVLRTK